MNEEKKARKTKENRKSLFEYQTESQKEWDTFV